MSDDPIEDLDLTDDELLTKYAHRYAHNGELCWVTDPTMPRPPAEALAIIKLHLVWSMQPSDTLSGELMLRMSDAIRLAAKVMEGHAARLFALETKAWIRDVP